MRQLCLYMIQNSEMTIIQAWIPKDHKWVEFRGTAYTEWRGNNGCDAERLHDLLEGNHASVLHSGDVLLLHEGHSDFERAWIAYERAEEKEFKMKEKIINEIKKKYSFTIVDLIDRKSVV